MRSRNGNRALLFAVCAITALPLCADEQYFISYKAVVEDALLYSETLSVSRSMQPCDGMPVAHLLLESEGSSELHKILQGNYEAFLPFIQKEGLHIRHHEETVNSISRSRSVLTMPPRCFTVDFNDDLVKITALK